MAGGTEFTFRDEALFLSGPGLGELRLRWHPVPTADRRLGTGKWLPYQPEFRLLAPMTALPPDMPSADKGRLQAKHEAFQAFRATLPAEQVLAVEPFTCHQWPLMTLLHRSDAARDLVKANPVLTYALANIEHLQPSAGHEVAILRANRYSRRKQKEILGWLGFPDTDAMARVVKKIPSHIVYPGLIRKLRQCCMSPDILKVYGHLPSLNTGLIYLACHPDMAALVTPKLLQEVASMTDEELSAPTADLLLEAITMADEMGQKDKLRPFTSYRKVHACRDSLAREYERFQAERERDRLTREAARAFVGPPEPPQVRRQRQAVRPPVNRTPPPLPYGSDYVSTVKNAKFPPPPIPGTPTIVPLQTFADLQAESAEQKNCVGRTSSYALAVLKGQFYLYKVFAPERHTLSIVKYGNNCWTIGELKRAGNAMGTKAAYVMVRAWRDANQISL